MTRTVHASLATILAAALAASLTMLAFVTEPAGAAFPGSNGRIFFETARDDGRTNIYSINPNGTGARSLPRSSAAIADTNPAVSPDGSKVAYEHDRDIWIMNADGSNPKPITTDGGARTDLQPAFSPDGKKIAFYGITSAGREIYTIHTNGVGLAQLTDAPTQDEQPAWSPDGTRIAYVVCCHNIWVMNANGTNKTNLTGTSTVPGVKNASKEPNFSPDGERIVFTVGPHCDFDCRGTDIYVMDSGGGGEVNLTPNGENHFQPVFSPDGRKITFTSNTINGTQFDIFTMNADGTGRLPLTNDAAMDANPDWGVPPPPDTVAPTGSVKINNGAARTASLRVRLTLRARDNPGGSGVARMCVSNAPRCSAWRGYSSSIPWRLASGKAGARTAYVRFKDRSGNVSVAYRDTIRYAPRR
jgi:TolB protein